MMAARLHTLLNGTLEEQGSGASSFVEYRVPRHAGRLTGRHFTRSAALRCLQNRTVTLLGDSRMRYLFASLGSLLSTEQQRESLPRHRACPFGNTPHKPTAECGAWYSNADGALQLSAGATRLSFVPNHWAADADRAAEALRRGRPDVLLANVGAWGTYLSKGYATKYDRSAAGHAIETTADRRRFFRTVRAALASEAVAVAVGYPECGCGGKRSGKQTKVGRHTRRRLTLGSTLAQPDGEATGRTRLRVFKHLAC